MKKDNKKKQSKVQSQDVEKLVESLGDKIAKAIAEAKGGATEKQEEDLSMKVGADLRNTSSVEYPSDLSSLEKDAKIATFFKALINSRNDAASAQVLRALVEGTDADGGYLVPEEFRAEVFRVMPDFTVMRNLARVLPMATDTLNLNTLGARPSAYWSTEYSSLSTTSADFGRVTLTPYTLVCLLPVTQQLMADANINVVQFITQLFAEEIGSAEDKAFFTGSGSGQPKGISQESLSSVAAGGSLTFDHVTSVIHSVPQPARNARSAAFVAHNQVIKHLRQVKDSQNRYIWEPGDPNNGQPERLYGYSLFEQNDLSQDQLYFGDWSNYIIGDRQQLSVSTTTEGGDAWRRHAMEIKAVERVDGTAVLTSPFAKITGIQS